MKVVIPMAGFGTRLRPHTYSRPKPLVNVAGQPLLKHVIDSLQDIEIDEYIFIVGYLGEQIEDYIRENHDIQARFVEQREMIGQAHAIYLAKDYLSGPAIILFSDTIFKGDLTPIIESQSDGIIYTMQVEDPRRFGVVVLNDEGHITDFIEKPDTMEHNNVSIGLYYVRDSRELIHAIKAQMEANQMTKGEFYIADALQRMINGGDVFTTAEVDFWLDCGKPETVLETNRFLLEHGSNNSPEVTPDGVTLVPPVFVHPDAHIENSVIGPYATISAGCTVTDSIIRNSIIDINSEVKAAIIEESLIGRDARVTGGFRRLNVGDTTSIDFS